MAKDKRTQSEIDGVEYRRAKLWQDRKSVV